MNSVNNLNKSTRTLVERHEKVIGSENRIVTGERFNTAKIRRELKQYFRNVSMFDITVDELRSAAITMDDWIHDYYKDRPEIIQDWEAGKDVPEFIDIDFKNANQECWDILRKKNQNKWVVCLALDKPIPQFQDLDIIIRSGFEVSGPFSHNSQTYYRVLELLGPIASIDKFLKVYKFEGVK